MKFLIKLEEKINQYLVSFYETRKSRIPEHLIIKFQAYKSWPIQTFKSLKPKLRVFKLKAIGYPIYYFDQCKIKIQKLKTYLKEKKYKEIDFQSYINRIKNMLSNPFAFFGLSIFLLVSVVCGHLIYKNVDSIVKGTIALRAPASINPEDLFVDFDQIKFTTKMNEDYYLDIKLHVGDYESMLKLDKKRDDIEANLRSLDLEINELPIKEKDDIRIANLIYSKLGGDLIKSVTVSQRLEKRPIYYKQLDRQVTFFNLNLQLFTEDTKRNRQVLIDFTVLSTNRTSTHFFRDNEALVRNHLTLNIEPIIPSLPIDEEGKQIIKDKIRQELQTLLDQFKTEGDVIDIYLESILVS